MSGTFPTAISGTAAKRNGVALGESVEVWEFFAMVEKFVSAALVERKQVEKCFLVTWFLFH